MILQRGPIDASASRLMAGFAIADLEGYNIWALFVLPECEGKGVGKVLQQVMLDWYFAQTRETVWLGTAPGTRAEKFYRQSGWTPMGMRKNGEARFEMAFEDWQKLRVSPSDI